MSRLSWEKTKLKTLINLSSRIPAKHKYTLKSHLISRYEVKDLHNTKGIFTYLSRADSYDIFTSLILAVHYGNWLSCDVLIRAQIESLLFSNWLRNNLDEIKNIFIKKIYREEKNLEQHYNKVEKDPLMIFFWDLYNRLYSQKAHPLPMRYLSSISFLRNMKPRRQDADFSQIMKRSFNKLPQEDRLKKLQELFEPGGYSPGVDSKPHNKDKKKSEHLTLINCYLYGEIKKILDEIEKNAPEYHMSDEEWEKSIKKYKRENYFLITKD